MEVSPRVEVDTVGREELEERVLTGLKESDTGAACADRKDCDHTGPQAG
jgi:hypothetical protein